ncbi:hypothetical protein [Peribacillus simplex]|uniref:hypothetical protein n=1 Tax=Peribacillus simplex TaxID=1478 RepID=UPI0021AA4E58|nr:hypothetical protein [Peribacillus simplex]
MEQPGDIHLLMTQLGHTSTTTAALYTNPEQGKAKRLRNCWESEEAIILKRIK